MLMSQYQEILAKLNRYKLQDKFADSVWESRGLKPSSRELCDYLSNLFNTCTDKLIAVTNQNVSEKEYKNILRNELRKLDKLHYDTEEKELICEYFYELANIVKVDFANDLNKWLYGSFLSALMRLTQKSGSEKIVDTLKQPCTNCGVILETYVTKYEEGIPESDFFIVRCNECGEYNLLNLGKNIKSFRFGNYKFEEKLWATDTTKEQAELRLEQIKHFRKR